MSGSELSQPQMNCFARDDLNVHLGAMAKNDHVLQPASTIEPHSRGAPSEIQVEGKRKRETEAERKNCDQVDAPITRPDGAERGLKGDRQAVHAAKRPRQDDLNHSDQADIPTPKKALEDGEPTRRQPCLDLSTSSAQDHTTPIRLDQPLPETPREGAVDDRAADLHQESREIKESVSNVQLSEQWRASTQEPLACGTAEKHPTIPGLPELPLSYLELGHDKNFQDFLQDLGKRGGSTSVMQSPPLPSHDIEPDLKKFLPGATSISIAPMPTRNPPATEGRQEAGLPMHRQFSFPEQIERTELSFSIEQMERELFEDCPNLGFPLFSGNLPMLMPSSLCDSEPGLFGQFPGISGLTPMVSSPSASDLGQDIYVGAHNDPFAGVHPDDWHGVAGPSSSTLPMPRTPGIDDLQKLQQLQEEITRTLERLNRRHAMLSVAIPGSAPMRLTPHSEGSGTYVGKGKGRAE